ncbi:hypothetical protein [Saccharothrix coeruleofusca]|uniref:hypothetical protein n=1 Tax=Saccharothrix coeruleofusca TaxID=33919 RepID=UPI00166F97DA|nr:hypothetical protein [Saccharothrix coeruleofusca]MBP2338308.1 hypothetical protein [Saccharothrix coeruleofusca]
MTVPRTLIWTSAPTAELQLALHRAQAGPAALVPVTSGTVLLPRRGIAFSAATRLAEQCRQVGDAAVVLRWNHAAELWTDGERAGRRGPARRLAPLTTWWRLKPVERPHELPRDACEVKDLVDEGRADTWVGALPRGTAHPINTVLPVVPVTQGGAPLA